MAVCRRAVRSKILLVLAALVLVAGCGAGDSPSSEDRQPASATRTPTQQAGPSRGLTLYQACQNTRVITHYGLFKRDRTGPEGNTMRWMQSLLSAGASFVEVDGQLSADHTEFLYHDDDLAAGTNGTGRLRTRSAQYLSQVTTDSGLPLGRGAQVAEVLQEYPKGSVSHEFKDQGGQWKPADLAAWYDAMAAAGVLSRLEVTSNSSEILGWFEANHPEVHTVLVGPYDAQLDLALVRRLGIDAVNVTFIAAFQSYDGAASYIEAAIAQGVQVGVRSKPTGVGDTPADWARAIRSGATALVVQDQTKRDVCAQLRAFKG